jgi:GAF domain-containing protein
MAENLTVASTATKQEKYEALVPQIAGLIAHENDLTANLSNIAAALKQVFDFFWVGFYIKRNQQLVLGPFQGPVACTRIDFDKGVCGACYREGKTILVPDVEQFPGHIACSSLSKSEIVLPVKLQGDVVMVLDVDSDRLNDFDETDQAGLEKVIRLLEQKITAGV